METLEQLTTPTDDPSNQKPKTSLPGEIIEELLLRLPVKSIFRFRSVSKQWLSLISAPSFPTLHSSRSHRTALFLSAYDSATLKRYFLYASLDGGPLTHITTVDTFPLYSRTFYQSEHLNGLVCFTSATRTSRYTYALVVNPSTHETFKLVDFTGSTNYGDIGDTERYTSYLFGFDESRNEHKVLNIRMWMRGTRQVVLGAPVGFDFEVFIFSISDYTWRKINAVLPWDQFNFKIIKCSVCVGGVIHFMFCNVLDVTFDVLTFDLKTEKFSTVDVPDDPAIRELRPVMKKINGCVALVGYDVHNSKVVIWMLNDYESRFWVRETVMFPEGWDGLDCPFSLDCVSKDEIVFASRRSSRDVMSVYVYNMKCRSFKQVEFTLTHPFLCLNTVEFDQINCYVESLMSLEGNGART